MNTDGFSQQDLKALLATLRDEEGGDFYIMSRIRSSVSFIIVYACRGV